MATDHLIWWFRRCSDFLMRAFVSIEVSGDVAGAIVHMQENLRVGRVVPEDNLHLTLAFLDDQPISALEALDEELSQLRMLPFDVSLKGLDVIGSGRGVRALTLMAEKVPSLLDLHDAVRRAARMAGITLERRRFQPHVTIARFGRNEPPSQPEKLQRFVSAYGNFFAGELSVEGFSLMRSTLTPDGPVYDELADYPFQSLV